MIIGGKDYPPPFEFWVPDYTDFKLPLKSDGSLYRDTDEEYSAYLNWLVVYMEKTEIPLNDHHKEILSDPEQKEWDAGRFGCWLGAAAFSEYYYFSEPKHNYPPDFLDDPRPERVCNPDTAEWESHYFNPESDETEEVAGMIDLQTSLIFDCMCWNATREWQLKCSVFPPGTAFFNDLGWRPLLKEAISRTGDWWEKKKTLAAFHREFSDMASK